MDKGQGLDLLVAEMEDGERETKGRAQDVEDHSLPLFWGKMPDAKEEAPLGSRNVFRKLKLFCPP